MNIDVIISTLFAVTMFEIPLLISLWFLVKKLSAKINMIKSSEGKGKDRKKDVVRIILLFLLIIIFIILAIFVILIAIAPGTLAAIPLSLKLILMFSLFIIYGCFASLFMGLGDVVGAGGSASKVIKSLSGYLYETLEINQANKHNNNKPLKTAEKEDRKISDGEK
jgi:hypothetical protein